MLVLNAVILFSLLLTFVVNMLTVEFVEAVFLLSVETSDVMLVTLVFKPLMAFSLSPTFVVKELTFDSAVSILVDNEPTVVFVEAVFADKVFTLEVNPLMLFSLFATFVCNVLTFPLVISSESLRFATFAFVLSSESLRLEIVAFVEAVFADNVLMLFSLFETLVVNALTLAFVAAVFV